MDEISEYMKEYRDLCEQIKELESKKDDMRTILMTYLKVNDLEEYEDEERIVSCTFADRNVFDKTKAIDFITEHSGDPNEFFTKNSYETLRVKDKGGR